LLRSGLSIEALEIYDQQTQSGQRELLLNWIEAAMQARATVSSEKLQAVYERLSVAERDELDKMAPKDWFEALTLKYRQLQASPKRPDEVVPAEIWQDYLDLMQ
jgi:hypothetical protein